MALLGNTQHLIWYKSLIPGPTRGPVPEDVVRSSPTNTERIDPSHDIKDIITQHKPASTTTSGSPTQRQQPQPEQWCGAFCTLTYWLIHMCVCVGEVTERSSWKSQTPMMKRWRSWKIRLQTHHGLYVASLHAHIHTQNTQNTQTRLTDFSFPYQSQKKPQSFQHKEGAGLKISKNIKSSPVGASDNVHRTPPPGELLKSQ